MVFQVVSLTILSFTSWLNYLDYDKIEFKGDDDFERYFQEQKARHKEYFEAFWI